MVAPTISILVPVHHRREFVLGALGSILAQTVPRETYEIIVVKNFDDEEIDRRIAELGVVHVRTDAGPLGTKLAQGFARCSGTLIGFLEDDDTFLPEKLAEVTAAFADPRLGYLHHAQEIVDRAGASLATNYRRETRRSASLPPGDRRPAAVRDFMRTSPGFNLSSMVVRREVLELALPYLARTNLTCDNLVLYAGLCGSGGVRNEGRPLTRYRLYASGSWGTATPEARFQRDREIRAELVAGFQLITEMTRGHEVAPFALCDLLERRALSQLADGGSASKLSATELGCLVRCRMLRREFSFPAMAAGLALQAISPGLERRLYQQYLRLNTARLGVG
ncbi:MAG TPA: glycosyltransferase [Thermoplasmata archaeon]|nr:glycosyltransferase [Thermoplasmata archaeon]